MSAQILESSGAVHRFIFLSDIAGSSQLAEAYPREYARALAQHNTLIEQAVVCLGGSVYKHTGDGYVALFESAGGCVACAEELAVTLAGIAPLVADEPLLVRIALHAGELQPAGTEYFGPALNRANRINQVCHPGQVLLSGAVAAALGNPPHGQVLRDLGLHHLRDLAEPEQLYQLDSASFARHEFPPPPRLPRLPAEMPHTQPPCELRQSHFTEPWPRPPRSTTTSTPSNNSATSSARASTPLSPQARSVPNSSPPGRLRVRY